MDVRLADRLVQTAGARGTTDLRMARTAKPLKPNSIPSGGQGNPHQIMRTRGGDFELRPSNYESMFFVKSHGFGASIAPEPCSARSRSGGEGRLEQRGPDALTAHFLNRSHAA